jgi:hypothetical protein
MQSISVLGLTGYDICCLYFYLMILVVCKSYKFVCGVLELHTGECFWAAKFYMENWKGI